MTSVDLAPDRDMAVVTTCRFAGKRRRPREDQMASELSPCADSVTYFHHTHHYHGFRALRGSAEYRSEGFFSSSLINLTTAATPSYRMADWCPLEGTLLRWSTTVLPQKRCRCLFTKCNPKWSAEKIWRYRNCDNFKTCSKIPGWLHGGCRWVWAGSQGTPG